MNRTIHILTPSSRSLIACVVVALLTVKPLTAQTVIWSGADATNNINSNWTDVNNWSGGLPTPVSNVAFNNLGANTVKGTVNNVVSASTTVATLLYGNTNNFHTTQINSGATLTVSNNAGASLLAVGTGQDNGGSQTEYTTITGGGTLSVISTNPGSFLSIQQGSATAGSHMATLDLSSLANFNFAAGRFLVGANAGSPAGSNRLGGTLYLALTNIIQANTNSPAIDVGDASGNGGTDYLYLGQTNAIFSDSIIIAHSKCTATMAFNPALAGQGPALLLRGYSSAAVSLMAIGDNSPQLSTGSAAAGTNNLTAGTVDALVNTCYVAHGQNGNGAGTATGNLSLGAGVFNVNTLNVGYMSTNTAAAAVTGTVNVNAPGTLVVNSNLVLGYNPGASVKATGTLNITGGNVLANAITTTAGSASQINSTINLTDGTLMISNSLASVTAPLTALNMADSVLSLIPSEGTARIFVTTLSTSSTTNDLINVPALPGIPSYPARFPLIAYGTLNNFDFLLGNLPNGFAGYVENNTTASTVDLVLTNGPVTVPTLTWNGNVNGNWDTSTTNWLNAGMPAAYHQGVAVRFDDSASGTTNVNLTTNLALGTLTVSNYVKSYIFSGTGAITGSLALTKTGNGTLSLTETGGDSFGGAIDANGGRLILDNANSAISAALTVDPGAVVQIGNNDANGNLPAGAVTDNGSLIFNQSISNVVSATIGGSGTLTQSGNGRLVLSGANTYTGNTTVTGGTLALSGAGTISNSPQVSVTSAAVDVAGATGPTLLQNASLANAALVVGFTNAQIPVILQNGLTMSGASNSISVVALPALASYPTTLALLQAAGGISGYNLSLGTLPVGCSGFVSESADNTTVLLTLTNGPVGVRPSVVWVGTDYVSATTNWSDAANWQLPGAPTPLDNVFFNDLTTVSQGTVNNVVDTNFTVTSLTFDQATSGAWHVTDIPLGVTLSVSNLNIGATSAEDGYVTSVAMTDAGTLMVYGNLTVGNFGATVLDSGTILDLSGLSNFVFSAASGTVAIATQNHSAANLNLAAASNNITAATINLNTGSVSASATGTVNLGAGTNILNVSSWNISAGREHCTVQFPNGSTGGGLRVRGVGGTDASLANVTMGNHNNPGGSGSAAQATLSLNGYPVDMKLGALILGEHSNASETGTGTGTGTISFDTGTISASNILMAITTTANTLAVANGTINVGANATLIVGPGGLSLVNQTAGTCSGTLNVTGGSLICSNNIVKTTTGGTGTITLTDGNLNLVSGQIGSAAKPVDALNLTDSALTLTANQTLTNIMVTALTTSSTTNDTINIASVSPVTSYPAKFRLVTYSSLNNYDFLLGTLPAGYQGYISNNVAASAVDLVLTNGPLVIVPTIPPHFTGFMLNFGNGTVTISGTNGQTGATYYLLSSTNLALPLRQWTTVATDVLSASAFMITNTVNLHAPQQFFILSSTNN